MAETPRRHVTIYTDGGCSGNPGPGGYGAVLLSGRHRRELSGGYRLTTNNRMEMLAAIMALETLKSPCDVMLYSDSTYLVSSIQQGSVTRWRQNGWRRKSGRDNVPVKNPDLWQRLLKAAEKHEVTFEWVKGHADVEENECCDRLAVAAAGAKPTDRDVAFEQEHPDLLAQATATTRARSPGRKLKVKQAGQPCPKCGTPVEKRRPKQGPKPGQSFYYAYFFACPGCRSNYMVEEGKREC